MKKLIIACLTLALSLTLMAQEGKKMTFQGSLFEGEQPFNGSTSIEFSIDLGGGNTWTETKQNVTVLNGLYSVVLGETTPLPEELFYEASERTLTIKVGGVTLGTVVLYEPFLPGVDVIDVDTVYAYALGIGTDEVDNATIDTDGNAAFAGNVEIGGTLTVNGEEITSGGGLSELPNTVDVDTLLASVLGIGTEQVDNATIDTDGNANFNGNVTVGSLTVEGKTVVTEEPKIFLDTVSAYAVQVGPDQNDNITLNTDGSADFAGAVSVNSLFVDGQEIIPGAGGGTIPPNLDVTSVNADIYTADTLYTRALTVGNGSANFAGDVNIDGVLTVNGNVLDGTPPPAETNFVEDLTGSADSVGIYSEITGNISNTSFYQSALYGFANNTSSNNLGVYGVAGSDNSNTGFTAGMEGLSFGAGTGPRYGVRGIVRGEPTYSVAVLGYDESLQSDGDISHGVYGRVFNGAPNATAYGVRGRSEGTGGLNIGIFGEAFNGAENWAGWFEGDVKVTGLLSLDQGFSNLNVQENGASFSVNIVNDPNGNDPAGFTSELFLFGDETPNIQMGGQPWENGDLAFLNLFGSNPDGNGWFYNVAFLGAGRDNGTGEEWGNIDLQYNDGATSFSTFNVDGRTGSAFFNGDVTINGNLNAPNFNPNFGDLNVANSINVGDVFNPGSSGVQIGSWGAVTGNYFEVLGNQQVPGSPDPYLPGLVSIGFNDGVSTGNAGWLSLRHSNNGANEVETISLNGEDGSAFFEGDVTINGNLNAPNLNVDPNFGGATIFGQNLDLSGGGFQGMRIKNSLDASFDVVQIFEQGDAGFADFYNNTGNVTISLQGASGTISLNDEAGNSSINLDGPNGNIFAPGSIGTNELTVGNPFGGAGMYFNGQNGVADFTGGLNIGDVNDNAVQIGDNNFNITAGGTGADDGLQRVSIGLQDDGSGPYGVLRLYNFDGSDGAIITGGDAGVSLNNTLFVGSSSLTPDDGGGSSRLTIDAISTGDFTIGDFFGSGSGAYFGNNGGANLASGEVNIGVTDNGNGAFGNMIIDGPGSNSNFITMGFADAGDISPFIGLWQDNGVGTDEYGLFNVVQGGPGGAVYGSMFLKDDLGNSVAINGFGDISATGTITGTTVTQTSDRRYKINISTLNNSLSNVLKLRGVSYNWIDPKKSDRTQIGVIAQEVEEVYPEFVHTNEDGYKSVNYSQMTAVLIEAIKELNSQVETLKTENAQLKAAAADTQALESRLEKLEKLLGVSLSEESNAGNE